MAQSVRTIRMKKKSEEEAFKSKTGKSVDEVLGLEASLSETEIAALIDMGGEFDEMQKVLVKSVTIIKSKLIEAARAKGWKEKEGKNFRCPVSQSTTTELDGKALVGLLKTMGKGNLVWDLLKPKIGDVKKYLGEKAIEPIADIKMEEFGYVSFKRKK